MNAIQSITLSVVAAAALSAHAAEWRVAQAGGDFTGSDEAPLLAALAKAQAAGGGVITVGPGVYRISRSLVFHGAKGVTLRGEPGAELQLAPALCTELAEAAPAGARTLALRSLEGLRPGIPLRILAPGETVAFTGKPRPNFTAAVAGVSNATVTLREPLAFPAPAGTRILNDKDPNLLVFSGACEDVTVENLTLDGALRPDGLRQAAHNTRCGAWIEGSYSYENGPSGPKPSRVTLRDCRIRNFHGRGVAIYSADDCAVERCVIENVLDEGIDFDHFAVRCHATGNTIRQAPVGVELNDANDCSVERNQIEACDTGIRIWRWCRQPDLNARNVIFENRLRGIRGAAVEFQAGTSDNTARGNALALALGEAPSPAQRFIDLGRGNRMDENTVTDAAVYQWGNETRGLRLGIRIEKKGAEDQNLFSFTAVVLNVSKNALILPLGDSWNPPACPVYMFKQSEQRLCQVAPPAVEHEGPGISHIPVPIGLAVEPGEVKVLHNAWFVPPVDAGEWTVSARFRPKEPSHEREERKNVWRSPELSSGEVTLKLLKTAEGPQPVRETMR